MMQGEPKNDPSSGPSFRVPSLDVSRADAVIGAEINGVDLSEPLGGSTFAAIESVFNERSVLCLRGQKLSEAQFIDFATRFGAVEKIFMTDYAHPDHPEIFLVSNIKENGKDIGHADAGSVWHSDMSYTERPPRATILYAVEVPFRDGVALGDTNFASAAAAYESLPPETKNKIDGLRVVHDVFGRRAKTGSHTQKDEERKKQPKPIHPFVRVHPHTGRKCLYVSPGECTGIVGMDDEEALPLLDELAGLIPQPPFRYRHKWQVGDVLIWDNCAVQHLATFDYRWPEERRLMWRMTVGGSVPV